MRRVEPGTIVAALGAGCLLVALFLDWYGPGMSAWTSFEVWDLVLAALAGAALAALAADLGWWRGPLPGFSVVAVAGVALLIVAVQLINHPPAAVGRGLETGAWVGLVGAVVLLLGALLSEARVSLTMTLDDEARRRRRSGSSRTADPVPEAPTESTKVIRDEPSS